MRPPMRSTSEPATRPASQRRGAAEGEREARLRERDPAHVVQVDDGEREDDPVAERVHDAAGLDEPDRARQMRVEPAQVRRQRRIRVLRYRRWSSRPGSRRCGWRRRSSSRAGRRTRPRWCDVELRHEGVERLRRGGADRALRRVGRPRRSRSSRSAGELLGDDPFALEAIGARLARAARRARGEGGARRGAARPLRQARRPPGLAAARAAARRARRPRGRSGSATPTTWRAARRRCRAGSSG